MQGKDSWPEKFITTRLDAVNCVSYSFWYICKKMMRSQLKRPMHKGARSALTSKSKTIFTTFFVGGSIRYVYTIQAEYLQISCIFCWQKFYHRVVKKTYSIFHVLPCACQKHSFNIILLGEPRNIGMLYRLNISKFGILIAHDSPNEQMCN